VSVRAPSAHSRTCAGCGRTSAREHMGVRIAAARDGSLGTGSSAPGRGAWLCGPGCLEEALRRGRLERALRRKLSSDDQVALRARLEA
jgi:predicted RNA-binding protein YlxR (DUF448 family)